MEGETIYYPTDLPDSGNKDDIINTISIKPIRQHRIPRGLVYVQMDWFQDHVNDEEDAYDNGYTHEYDHDDAFLYQRDGWYSTEKDKDDEYWHQHEVGNGRA